MRRVKGWRGRSADHICNVIDEYVIGHNALQHREILKECIVIGATQEAAAEKFEVSPRHVQRILSEWLPILDAHIAD